MANESANNAPQTVKVTATVMNHHTGRSSKKSGKPYTVTELAVLSLETGKLTVVTSYAEEYEAWPEFPEGAIVECVQEVREFNRPPLLIPFARRPGIKLGYVKE